LKTAENAPVAQLAERSPCNKGVAYQPFLTLRESDRSWVQRGKGEKPLSLPFTLPPLSQKGYEGRGERGISPSFPQKFPPGAPTKTCKSPFSGIIFIYHFSLQNFS